MSELNTNTLTPKNQTQDTPGGAKWATPLSLSVSLSIFSHSLSPLPLSLCLSFLSLTLCLCLFLSLSVSRSPLPETGEKNSSMRKTKRPTCKTVIWECYDYLQESDQKPQSIQMFIFTLQSLLWEMFSWKKEKKAYFSKDLFLESLLNLKIFQWVVGKNKDFWIKVITLDVYFVRSFRPSKKDNQESSKIIPLIFKKMS